MNKEQKQEVIETLKNKFSQYSNFYITDTQNLSVAQITNLRRHCFDKQVEMKVAKNTLIKKALESLDNDKYSGVYDSLHQVTALMFSDSPKEPALIISSFRKSLNGEKPLLKAAFLNGDIFVGDNQLVNLTKIKTKNELIGEVIGLLMAPIQRVIGALQNKFETPEVTGQTTEETEAKAEVAGPKAVATEATPVAETKPEATGPVADATKSTAKVDVAEPKTVSTEATSDTKPVAETKPEVVEPAPAKVEIEEPKPVPTEPKSDTKPVTETKPEVVEPARAKVKIEEPKTAATEATSETKPEADTKPEVVEPLAAKVEVTESKAVVPDTEATGTKPPVTDSAPGKEKSDSKGSETQPEA